MANQLDLIDGNYFKNIPLSQQDQFVDNRNTLGQKSYSGNTHDDRLNQMLKDQGLVDLSLDVAIPGGQMIGAGIRGVSGLGLRGLEHMNGIKNSLAAGSNIPIDAGRREAMKLGGAGMGAGAIASVPVINIATKGLGLSDNIVAAGAKAPVNIASLENRIGLMDTAFERTLQNGTRSQITMPSMIKAKDNYYNSIIKADPDSGQNIVKMLKTGNDDPGLNFALNNLNRNNKDVASALAKESDVWRKAKRIQEKSKTKINNARASDVPVISPKELKIEIAKAKSKEKKSYDKVDKLYKSKHGENHPSLDYNIRQHTKYDNQVNQMERQLEELSKTGKYNKASKTKIDEVLPKPPREDNLFLQ